MKIYRVLCGPFQDIIVNYKQIPEREDDITLPSAYIIRDFAISFPCFDYCDIIEIFLI